MPRMDPRLDARSAPFRDWSPASWRSRVASHQPDYPDTAAVERVMARLNRLPPLVSEGEVERLREELAAAARGERFLLQGGDCAESFADCNADRIESQLGMLMQMGLVLAHGLGKRVVHVGRIAGQFAKPRSAELEQRGAVALPSYKGDLINHAEFSLQARAADPELLLRGYERAALTLNYARALRDGGFADVRQAPRWALALFERGPAAARFRARRDALLSALAAFAPWAHPQGCDAVPLLRPQLYTSHEGLHLAYEQAQTRIIPSPGGGDRAYDLSTHFPWIGVRTAGPDSAHVEFFRGIANPIGMKVGPRHEPATLARLCEVLDPQREPGRLTLIHRLGAERIERQLPELIAAVERTGRRVLWCCDPMHGNTETLASGVKTRRFERIRAELDAATEIHAKLGVPLGGIHVEVTGDAVTECIGGAFGLDEAGLDRNYRSQVDPRLNREQALELAFRIADGTLARDADGAAARSGG
jgi:3-deoxy-7-phosphoheptulonate synthase